MVFIIVIMLFYRYRLIIMEELSEFVSSKVSLYLGVFLAAVSAAFIIQTDNFWVISIASTFTIIAIILVLAFLIRQLRKIPRGTRLRLGG